MSPATTQTTSNEGRWAPAFPSTDLSPGGAKLFRREGLQVAVFRTEDGQLHAVDNACPHEGYPLLQGQLAGCQLTCAWHNFKFDLRDGSCVLGEEDVRSYPVRELDGTVEVDLAEPDPAAARQKYLTSLEQGMVEHELGRVGRDVVRLIESGMAPQQIAVWGASFDARHSPWGSRHALAVAADVLRYFDRREGSDATLPLLHLLDLASETNIRYPERPRVEAATVSKEELSDLGPRIRELVEQENGEAAESLVRGAIAAGASSELLERWFHGLLCDHFYDFGHPLIYQGKLGELLRHAGAAEAEDLWVGQLLGIVFGTREDTLPPMSSMTKQLGRIADELPSLMELQKSPRPAGGEFSDADRAEFRKALLDGKAAESMELLTELLRRGVPTADLIDEIVLAASERVLRFDYEIDLDPNTRENWLFVTHPLTTASAVRTALRRYTEPDSLKLLFHAAAFLNHKKPLDLAADRRVDVEALIDRSNAAVLPTGESAFEPANLIDAIARKDAAAALSITASALSTSAQAPTGKDAHDGSIDEMLVVALSELALDDPAVRPIFTAHIIKMVFAAIDETRALGSHRERALPLLAAVCFAASPIQQARVGRIAQESVNFVAHAKRPHRLTT